MPIGKCKQQFLDKLFHRGKTLDGLKSSRKIYEIVGKQIIELIQPACVSSVMIAMKQFERLLSVHVQLLQFFKFPSAARRGRAS
jgi:hypothetical protein